MHVQCDDTQKYWKYYFAAFVLILCNQNNTSIIFKLAKSLNCKLARHVYGCPIKDSLKNTML